MKGDNKYWISEYVITKNDVPVRGIYISRRKFDKSDYYIVIFSVREIGGYHKRGHRKNLLTKFLSSNSKLNISEVKESEEVNLSDFDVLRKDIERVPFDVLAKLYDKLDGGGKVRFKQFFEGDESKRTDKRIKERS